MNLNIQKESGLLELPEKTTEKIWKKAYDDYIVV